jgi:hypothetical protein
MHIKFRDYAESLHPKFESLMSMPPIHICDLPKELPPQCIYLFTEGPTHLYVGRTLKQSLKKRLQQHSAAWAQHNQAVFAFKLAREAIDVRPGYTPRNIPKIHLRHLGFPEGLCRCEKSYSPNGFTLCA